MTTWEVLRWNDGDSVECWEIAGTWETESNYDLGYSPEVARELGKRFGTGSYLFLNNQDKRFETFTVAARQEFYEAENIEPVSEPSISEIMDREG